MFFTTDKQTLEDLNIFGRPGSDSIYSIFNHCATRGGAVVLEEMFRHPLKDAVVIKRRSEIIQYFSNQATVFPFSSTDFDGIEAYLSNTDERSKVSNQEQSLSNKLSNLIAADTGTKSILKAVIGLTELLTNLHDFIRSLHVGSNERYYVEVVEMLALVSAVSPSALRGLPSDRLSHDQLAEYDLSFRFRSRDNLNKLLRQIYHLDVYLAVAKTVRNRHLVFPNALPGSNGLVIEGLYHPQVKNAVPNDLSLGTDKNVLFLTGANMAGKSTFMKSVSLAVYLAHLGFPVPARKMDFSVMDGIYTNINLPDSLGLGASHFYAEVLRVKKVAKELSTGKNLFIVFDELFRGTNVKDAYEATIAVVGAFALKQHSIFVISTHIIEAGEILKSQHENLRFLYLPTRMAGLKPIYTYTLKEGITDDRHGMIIINNERILEILEAGMYQTD